MSMEPWDALWVNASLATMVANSGPYGAIARGALAVREGRIAWVGAEDELPGDHADRTGSIVDAGGRWITPGLIDCHTHLVFGGNRAREFEERLRGASYEEIARRGGGIRSTVERTRAASAEELFHSAASRIGALLGEGVTTVEIKSGYGLDIDSELTMLRVARELGERLPVTVQTTFLGAHALPTEFEGRREAYLRLVREEMLPAAVQEGLADAVDAFCEGIAFSVRECRELFEEARNYGLPVRLHADQLSDCGGAALAGSIGARSADHLEFAHRGGISAMASAGTVAVLLPGAHYYLGGGRPPPVDDFRAAGVTMALASDCNPGSAPLTSLLLTLNMGCVLFGLTPAEALAGVTRNAAAALGLRNDRGTLEVGKVADLALWEIEHPRELSYWIGTPPAPTVVKEGEVITPSTSSAA